jgi:hypothetical protein
MRHAKVKVCELSEEGKSETRDVAGGLCQQLEEGWRVHKLVHADSPEALATARFLTVLVSSLPKVSDDAKWDALAPTCLRTYRKPDGSKKLKDQIRQITDLLPSPTANGPNDAVLIIGHMPLLGWIAHELVDEAVPISHSEIVCIDLDKPRSGSPRWVLSPSDPAAIADLRDKIKSKMDVAKLLGGFLTVVLGFLLATLADEKKVEFLNEQIWTVGLAFLLFFASIVLYLATMYKYDSLLMPKRFWGETRAGWLEKPSWIVERPPSSAHWVLYQNMIHIWTHVFTPATGCLLVGLGLVTYAVLGPKCGVLLPHVILLAMILMALVAGVCFRRKLRHWYRGIQTRLRRWFGPWIGSED